MVQDGSIARHYDFTTQLAFAEVLTQIYQILNQMVHKGFPLCSNTLNLSLDTIKSFQSNLHLEADLIPSVNTTVEAVNEIADSTNEHAKFPDCKIMNDFWKLHAYDCPDPLYKINGTLGTPR